MTSLNNTRKFDFKNICDEFEKQLGPNSPYDMQRREEYMELRRYGKVQGPIVGKWLHGSMIKFFENRKSLKGNKDMYGDPHVKETDGFCCALPVVVKFAGESGLMDKVLKIATTQSTWPVAFKHALVASKIVEGFVLGSPDPILGVREAIKGDFPEIYKELNTVDSLLSTPHTEAVGYVFGRPCYNPGNLYSIILKTVLEDFDF